MNRSQPADAAVVSWKALGRTMFRMTAMSRELDPMHRAAGKRDNFFLWVDAVGGYWVCLSDTVTLGQAGEGGGVDVPLLGDLSKRHAVIRRDGEGYLLEPLREVWVDGRPVTRFAALADGSQIRLGRGVKLIFRRPHALSATARLDFASSHRTQPTVDAVLLMADSCVLGPRRHSHVVCRDWSNEVVLYRHDDQLYCRADAPVEIDGVRYGSGRAALARRSHIVGDKLSVSLEEMRNS